MWHRVALRGVPCTRGRPSRSSVRVGVRRECRVPCGRLVACFCACARSGPLAGPCAHTSLESGTDLPSGELVSGGGRMAPGELRPRTRAGHRPVQRPGSAPSFPEVLGTPRRPRPAAVAPHGGLGCEASACGVTTSRMKPHVTAGPGRRSGACLPAAAGHRPGGRRVGRGPSWGPPVSARRPAPSARAPLPGASPSVSCRSGPRKVREGAGGQARGGRGSAVLLAGLRPPGLRSSVRSEAPAQCRRRLALGGASCGWRGRTALQGVTQPQGGARPAPAKPSAPCARVCAPRACPVSGRGAGSAPSFRRPARGRPQARTRSGGVRVAF